MLLARGDGTKKENLYLQCLLHRAKIATLINLVYQFATR